MWEDEDENEDEIAFENEVEYIFEAEDGEDYIFTPEPVQH